MIVTITIPIIIGYEDRSARAAASFYYYYCYYFLLLFLMITTTIIIIVITPSPPIKSLDFRGFDSSRLNYEGWEFSCPYDFIGGLPESLTQGLLVGKLLVGGLGVSSPNDLKPYVLTCNGAVCIRIYLYLSRYRYI